MHVNDIKKIVSILQGSGVTNKESQACLLGYVIGLEAPISLGGSPDDQVEWNSFFNEIPGEVNEHYVINLDLAKDVADLTLKYRQAVTNADDKIEDLAKKFLTTTGAAFGLLGKEGSVRQIRQVIGKTTQERRAQIETRRTNREDETR